MVGVSYVGDMGYVPAGYIDTMLDDLRTHGRKILAKAEAAARESGVDVKTLLIETKGGSIADAILGAARKVRADVIVLGTHGRRGLSRVLMGSDAEAVLREARIPVMLVRSPESSASTRPAKAASAPRASRTGAGETTKGRGRSASPQRSGPSMDRSTFLQEIDMPHAIRIHATGGPEVMAFEEVALGEPGPGRGARPPHGDRRQLHRHVPSQRAVPVAAAVRASGTEAAGVVEAVGPGVDWVRPGDRVAYCTGAARRVQHERIVPADRLVKLPDGIDDRPRPRMMLKGLTVQYLFRQTYPLKGGETILFHAAAGGVGLIACQWARALGVTMIGTVGSDEKAALAREQRLRAHHRLHARELRRAREGDHRRQGRAGRLRRRSARTRFRHRSTAWRRAACS